MNDNMIRTDKFARAVAYACKLHDGTFRDDGKTPYGVHPIRVAEHLRRIAGEQDENMLCAAILHDTVEDTAVNYDDVALEFGDDIATLVAELTVDRRLPKARRRAAMIEHLPQLSERAKKIKLADRLDNVTDLVNGTGKKEKRARYIEETERLLHALSGACEPLERALRAALQNLRDMPQ